MNDLSKLIYNTANSRTTTKVLSTLVISIAAAYLLRTGNSLLIIMTLFVVALTALNIFITSYANAKNKDDKPRQQPGLAERKLTSIQNALLTSLTLILISIIT